MPFTSLSTVNQLSAKLEQPAKLGGWAAIERMMQEDGLPEVEQMYNNILEEYTGHTFPNISTKTDAEILGAAHSDFAYMQKQIRVMDNCRMGPCWGIPAEIYKMVFNPNLCFKKQKKGVGADAKFGIAIRARQWIVGALQCKKRSLQPGIQERFSQAVSIAKKSISHTDQSLMIWQSGRQSRR